MLDRKIRADMGNIEKEISCLGKELQPLQNLQGPAGFQGPRLRLRRQGNISAHALRGQRLDLTEAGSAGRTEKKGGLLNRHPAGGDCEGWWSRESELRG